MFLTVAAIVLLLVILAQNIWVPALREETVSDGLYGPMHWWLDGAYLLLISALLYTFVGGPGEFPAAVAAFALFVTMISNTFSGWVDKWTDNQHATIHTWFSILMFIAMLTLEVFMNHGALWLISLGGMVAPALVFGILYALKIPGVVIGPQVEKAAIFMLCVWLAMWGHV